VLVGLCCCCVCERLVGWLVGLLIEVSGGIGWNGMERVRVRIVVVDSINQATQLDGMMDGWKSVETMLINRLCWKRCEDGLACLHHAHTCG
jgi:hypothetical protein